MTMTFAAALLRSALLIFATAAPQSAAAEPEPQDAKAAASKPASRPASHPAAAADEPKEESLLAIVNADVETVTAGRLRGATVLMKGAKIWKVGRNVTIPEGARKIDASGLRVYPGLVVSRATGIGMSGFGAGGRNVDRYNPFSLEVIGCLAGGITTVCQSDTVMKMLTHSLESLSLRDVAYLRLAYGTGQQRYDMRERLEHARNYLLDLREFEAKKAAGDAGAKEPKKEGVDDNLLRLLRREISARFEVDDVSQMLPILSLIDDYRFDCVFSGGLEAWAIADEISRRGVKVIFSPRRRQEPDQKRNAPNGSSAEAASVLRKAGVEFALYPPPGFDGGDNIAWDGIAGRELQTIALDAAWCVRGGLDEQSALESITISPARILGVADRVGSIEPGKDGDLILTDGNILDFRTFVQMAIVNGEVQYEKAKVPLYNHVRPRSSPPTEVPAYPPKTAAEKKDHEPAAK